MVGVVVLVGHGRQLMSYKQSFWTGVAAVIPVVEGLDGGNGLLYTAEDAAANRLPGNNPEKISTRLSSSRGAGGTACWPGLRQPPVDCQALTRDVVAADRRNLDSGVARAT